MRARVLVLFMPYIWWVWHRITPALRLGLECAGASGKRPAMWMGLLRGGNYWSARGSGFCLLLAYI